jgi:hypothetical protein
MNLDKALELAKPIAAARYVHVRETPQRHGRTPALRLDLSITLEGGKTADVTLNVDLPEGMTEEQVTETVSNAVGTLWASLPEAMRTGTAVIR